jgi:hypothetical protein
MQGRTDDALEILECLNEKSRDDPYIKNELLAIQETVKEMSKGSYRSLFDMSEYREFHRVALAYINQMFQQISGINLITYYVRYPHTPPISSSTTKELWSLTEGAFLGAILIQGDWSRGRQPSQIVGCLQRHRIFDGCIHTYFHH